MKTIYLIIAVTFFNITLCRAQNVNTSTIQWNVTHVENSEAGISEGAGDKLISYPGDKVEWKDANGDIKLSFEITSTIGTWSDASQNGLIHFSFQLENQPGEIIIQRSGNVLSAEIQLYKADVNPQTYNLQISGYTVL